MKDDLNPAIPLALREIEFGQLFHAGCPPGIQQRPRFRFLIKSSYA